MFNHIIIIITIFWIFFLTALPSNSSTPDPLILYGNNIHFSIYRNGKNIGDHNVVFQKNDNGNLIVEVSTIMNIKIFGITIYNFSHSSTALWNNGKLVNLIATTDDDGNINTFKVEMKNNNLVLFGTDNEIKLSPELLPTTHWNSNVLDNKEVINTLNGEISSVDIVKQKKLNILAQNQTIEAVQYVYTGDIDATFWYDLNGRWVKLKFKAKDGSYIEYECTICGLQ